VKGFDLKRKYLSYEFSFLLTVYKQI